MVKITDNPESPLVNYLALIYTAVNFLGGSEMAAETLIILISLLLGLASGAIMHRSDFCIAGMFRDLFLFRYSPQLPSLILLIAVSMLLFEGAQLAGLLSDNLATVLFGAPALTIIPGGILFGIGMVLAGGCVVGTLYKLGSGSLTAVAALFGLVTGSTLYAEFHPQWLQLQIATRLGASATLPQLLETSPAPVFLMVLTILAIVLYRWQQGGQLHRPSVIQGTLQPATAALLLAVIGLISLVLLGMPLGITTAYAKAGGFFEQLLAPKHVASLTYFQGQDFSYFSPLSNRSLTGGTGPFLDGISLVQFPLLLGIALGSAVSSAVMGKFRCRFDVPKRQLVSALIGGLMMGLASRMAPSCNIWHLLGGLPLLSLQSILFTIGLFPGAWIGTRLLTRYVLPA